MCASYIPENFLDPSISLQITSHEYTLIHTESQYTDILNALPKQITIGKLLDVMSCLADRFFRDVGSNLPDYTQSHIPEHNCKNQKCPEPYDVSI